MTTFTINTGPSACCMYVLDNKLLKLSDLIIENVVSVTAELLSD